MCSGRARNNETYIRNFSWSWRAWLDKCNPKIVYTYVPARVEARQVIAIPRDSPSMHEFMYARSARATVDNQLTKTFRLDEFGILPVRFRYIGQLMKLPVAQNATHLHLKAQLWRSWRMGGSSLLVASLVLLLGLQCTSSLVVDGRELQSEWRTDVAYHASSHSCFRIVTRWFAASCNSMDVRVMNTMGRYACDHLTRLSLDVIIIMCNMSASLQESMQTRTTMIQCRHE